MNGWIKLHRKLKETSFYNKPLVLSLFIHLLLSANHKDKKFLWNGKEITIKKGSLITGLFSLSKNTGISIQSIRTALTNLKSTSTITIKSTNKFSIISICNWEQYQGELTSTSTNKQQADFKDFNKKSKKSTSKLTSKKPQEKECKSTSKLTNNQQTTNKQLTTNKNERKEYIYLISLFNKLINKEYQPTEGRFKKYKARLKTYSYDQLKRALNNITSQPFYKGDNDRGWIIDPDYFLRSDEIIDKALNMKAPIQRITNQAVVDKIYAEWDAK